MIRFTRWLGLVFVAGGFVAIAIGWNQMARLTCVDCQLPYLLSAGGAGIGLVVLGVALLLIAQLRVERARFVEAIGRLAAAFGGENDERPGENDERPGDNDERPGDGDDHLGDRESTAAGRVPDGGR